MRIRTKPAIVAAFCCLAFCVCAAQQTPSRTTALQKRGHSVHQRRADRALNSDEGLSVIAAALDSRVRRDGGFDCSHLVHAIYERAGFRYDYANSYDLYDGIQGFRRVWQPQPGDVIVWPGHAGIVVRPSRHVFFSFLSAGPTIDDYRSPYWTARGIPRFYRYVKGSPCAGCPSVNASLRESR